MPAPSFSGVTPGAILIDGTNGTGRIENSKSVLFSDGYAIWPDSVLYEQKSFTVELFAKVTGTLGSSNNLIRLNMGSNGPNDSPVWALYSPSAGKIMVRAQCVADGSSASLYTSSADIGRPFADGRWHHYALTVEPSTPTNTRVSVYCDYCLVVQDEIKGSLDYGTPGGHRLLIGSPRATAQ